VSSKHPNYERAQAAMKDVCTKCHVRPQIDDFYAKAEQVLAATNEKVRAITTVMDGLRNDGILSPTPFAAPIDFDEFDAWHFYGHTAKHGAFMGGADFTQWHGNYELLRVGVKIEHAAAELRTPPSEAVTMLPAHRSVTPGRAVEWFVAANIAFFGLDAASPSDGPRHPSPDLACDR
jgi:hydroxylamine dehydrogenase